MIFKLRISQSEIESEIKVKHIKSVSLFSLLSLSWFHQKFAFFSSTKEGEGKKNKVIETFALKTQQHNGYNCLQHGSDQIPNGQTGVHPAAGKL